MIFTQIFKNLIHLFQKRDVPAIKEDNFMHKIVEHFSFIKEKIKKGISKILICKQNILLYVFYDISRFTDDIAVLSLNIIMTYPFTILQLPRINVIHKNVNKEKQFLQVCHREVLLLC